MCKTGKILQHLGSQESSDRIAAPLRLCRRPLSCVCVARVAAVGGGGMPCSLGDTPLAELILLDLTAFGAWQLVHEFEISRDREIGQAGLAKRNQFRFRELLAQMENESPPHFILRKR